LILAEVPEDRVNAVLASDELVNAELVKAELVNTESASEGVSEDPELLARSLMSARDPSGSWPGDRPRAPARSLDTG
jgi:hypothetical protein